MIVTSTSRFTKLINPSVLKTSVRRMSVINLSDKSAVNKFIAGNDKCVTYLTASWCPPCKMISPIFEKLSKTHNEIAFGKVDVDDNPETASEFQISSVPTFIFHHNNEVYQRFSGADQNQLEEVIAKLGEE